MSHDFNNLDSTLFEDAAAMLSLSEAKFILENNTILIIKKKYLNRANFFKSLLHKLTLTVISTLYLMRFF